MSRKVVLHFRRKRREGGFHSSSAISPNGLIFRTFPLPRSVFPSFAAILLGPSPVDALEQTGLHRSVGFHGTLKRKYEGALSSSFSSRSMFSWSLSASVASRLAALRIV